MFLKIYVTHIIYVYVYKSFCTILDKGLRKNVKKKRQDEKIGKHKLNEMGTVNMKQSKTNQIKVKDPDIVQLFFNMAAHQKYI